jgi:hypothetical protein
MKAIERRMPRRLAMQTNMPLPTLRCPAVSGIPLNTKLFWRIIQLFTFAQRMLLVTEKTPMPSAALAAIDTNANGIFETEVSAITVFPSMLASFTNRATMIFATFTIQAFSRVEVPTGNFNLSLLNITRTRNIGRINRLSLQRCRSRGLKRI